MEYIAFFALILFAGWLMAWNQRRLQGQVASLPPETRARLRKRMLTVFLPVMAGIIVLVFLLIFLLRPHV
jgi:hypothetical protein